MKKHWCHRRTGTPSYCSYGPMGAVARSEVWYLVGYFSSIWSCSACKFHFNLSGMNDMNILHCVLPAKALPVAMRPLSLLLVYLDKNKCLVCGCAGLCRFYQVCLVQQQIPC